MHFAEREKKPKGMHPTGLSASLVGLSILVSISGCTSNLSINPLGQGQSVPASNPNDTSSGQYGAFALSRVALDGVNPGSIFDLYGDGSGTIGNVCGVDTTVSGATTTGDTTSQPSNCECQYSYSSASAPNQQIFTPVTYHENDLVRCSYNPGLPADVTSVNVAIHDKPDDTYSNVIVFSFTGTTGIASVDLSNINSFINPVRYQCRDIITIGSMFQGDSSSITMYDPFQSEDPHLTYPIDFYSTSFGQAVQQLADPNNLTNTQNWNCPTILNPSQYLVTTAAVTAYNATTHTNLTVYSKAALGGSKVIYPPTSTNDRSTFYVAKTSAGVFTTEVDGVISPGLTGSLGYGAAPIPVGTGTGQESCPDTTVTIPSGYHWMKLWLFRASLAQRNYATSGTNGIANTGGLVCNPGNVQVANSGGGYSTFPTFTECPLSAPGLVSLSNASFDSATNPFIYGTPNLFLADRIFASSQQCVTLQGNAASSYALCDGTSTSPYPGLGCANNGSDSRAFDAWVDEAPIPVPSATPQACSVTPQVDVMNTCSSKQGVGTVKVPANYNIGTANLDASSSGGSGRYDFLFVVTPPSINLTDMQNNSASSNSLAYQPYRFLTDLDCNAPDPDNAPSGTCLLANAINNYGLKLHSVATNGDPPASDPNRAGVFPVCVLQPN